MVSLIMDDNTFNCVTIPMLNSYGFSVKKFRMNIKALIKIVGKYTEKTKKVKPSFESSRSFPSSSLLRSTNLYYSTHFTVPFARVLLFSSSEMNNSTAAPSSKPRAGSSQPSEASFKRKRGVFQKDCE